LWKWQIFIGIVRRRSILAHFQDEMRRALRAATHHA
jgi:hypothetical protein